MTVKDFIDNGAGIQGIKYKNYIPYEKKVAICKSIIQKCYYDENHNFKRQSEGINMIWKLNLVNEYTDIKIDFSNMLSEYNELAENGILSSILGNLPEYDINEFQGVLSALSEDEMINYYDHHAFISQQVERFGNLIGFSLKPAIEGLASSINELDDDKIKKLGKTLNSVIRKVKTTGKKATTTATATATVDTTTNTAQ